MRLTFLKFFRNFRKKTPARIVRGKTEIALNLVKERQYYEKKIKERKSKKEK